MTLSSLGRPLISPGGDIKGIRYSLHKQRWGQPQLLLSIDAGGGIPKVAVPVVPATRCVLDHQLIRRKYRDPLSLHRSLPTRPLSYRPVNFCFPTGQSELGLQATDASHLQGSTALGCWCPMTGGTSAYPSAATEHLNALMLASQFWFPLGGRFR